MYINFRFYAEKCVYYNLYSLSLLECVDIQGWVSKSIRMTLKRVTMQLRESVPCCDRLTQSFWLCKQKSQEVSWHCTFKSRRKKNTSNTKISLHNTSCICLHFPVSYAPPLIEFPCENVYTASHSSQPPHGVIKMPFKALLSVSGFTSAFEFDRLPSGVSLESLSIPLGLRSLWTEFREQMLRDCKEHKLVRWNLWVE